MSLYIPLKTFETFDRDALAALQARDVLRVRAADYFAKEPGAGAEADQEFAQWDAYLAGFAKLTDAKCLCCGTSLRCVLGLGFFGGFEWGLAHGEGHCSSCHYPMRGYHHVDGLGTIRNLYLAYHPSALSFTADMKEEP